jgi:SRSO17 transposase
MQRLLRTADWDADAVRDELRGYVLERLGPGGVLIVDETGFIKKGTRSAGVARQYTGTTGKIDNCQIGVFLAYATPTGRALIDRELYLPRAWTDDRNRARAAGVDDEVGFATKPELARVMIERVVKAGLPFGWVAADEFYGDNPGLRGWLESEYIRYVMAVSCDHAVATVDGAQRADVLAAGDGLVWRRLSCGNGAKGPRMYDFAEIPDAVRSAHRLVVRRAIDDGELAYFWCHTPTGATLADLVRVIGMRWAVEECFQAAKGQVGLDHYQVRSYPGWYRHITLAIAAHSWLTVTATLAARQKGNRHRPVPLPHQPIP